MQCSEQQVCAPAHGAPKQPATLESVTDQNLPHQKVSGHHPSGLRLAMVSVRTSPEVVTSIGRSKEAP